MPRLILTFELFRSQHNTRRPHARFTHTMTEPHHALTVDGEGEDSGGNEVHEIYVRLGAAPATALNEKDTTPCQNEIKDTTPCKSFQLSKDTIPCQNEIKDTTPCKSFQLSKRTRFRVKTEIKDTTPCKKRERTQFRVELLKRTQLRVYL